MPTVKIKLKTGIREIEIEGNRSDVDELLANWWAAPGLIDQQKESVFPRTAESTLIGSGSTDTRDDIEHPFDANDTVNQIKQQRNFAAIERKIILARGDHFQKVALVLSVSNSPLTSGQIHRVLEALSIKITLSGVSKLLKANIGKFLTSTQRRAGGPPATYRLTAHARADFDNWLAGNG